MLGSIKHTTCIITQTFFYKILLLTILVFKLCRATKSHFVTTINIITSVQPFHNTLKFTLNFAILPFIVFLKAKAVKHICNSLVNLQLSKTFKIYFKPTPILTNTFYNDNRQQKILKKYKNT